MLKKIIVNTLFTAISKTWRIKINGQFPDSPAIIVFWHGAMLPAWKIFSKFHPVGVVSKSKDGQILSDLLQHWGFRLIRGSSSTDAKEVLIKMVLYAKDNYVLITPDGPKGPINKFKPGAAIASARTGTPIHFLNVNIIKSYTFKKSWDKFQFPKLFSQIEIEISEPMLPATDSREDINSFIVDIETKMNAPKC